MKVTSETIYTIRVDENRSISLTGEELLDLRKEIESFVTTKQVMSCDKNEEHQLQQAIGKAIALGIEVIEEDHSLITFRFMNSKGKHSFTFLSSESALNFVIGYEQGQTPEF